MTDGFDHESRLAERGNFLRLTDKRPERRCLARDKVHVTVTVGRYTVRQKSLTVEVEHDRKTKKVENFTVLGFAEDGDTEKYRNQGEQL